MSERIGIIGEIDVGPGGKPVFRRIRHDYELQDAGPNVRPCPHRTFVLDEEWKTVTCGECHERLDAYAVLAQYAEWEAELDRKHARIQEDERQLHLTELRRLLRVRGATPEEREEIDKALRRRWSLPLADLRAMLKRIHNAIGERAAKRA